MVEEEARIARAYEERMFRLNELWNKLSKSIEHRRALEVRERLIVSNAPKRFYFITTTIERTRDIDGYLKCF